MSKDTTAPALKNWLAQEYGISPTLTEGWTSKAAQALTSGKLTPEKLAELSSPTHPDNAKRPNAADAFGGARVKGPAERYSNVKSVGRHVKYGQPILNEKGVEVRLPSQLEHAKSGAFLKLIASRSGINVGLNDHDRELMELNYQDSWCGRVGSEWSASISGAHVKALLNDSTSGGAEVVPEYFDTMLISFPLLHSELLPLVTMLEVPRGASVEGASIGNPTASWNYNDGTGLTPFNTDSLCAGLTTPIFPLSCAVEVGRDFLSDAADTVGRVLTDNIGQRMLSEIDRVIANGNGTSEPLGLLGTSGATDIGNPAAGAGGDPAVTDYESLIFGLPKQYRNSSMRCALVGNDVTYKRARGIPVSGSDTRRVFGMDHQSYELLQYPFKVENNLANSVALFAALSRYRLYRRAGFTTQFESGGKELVTKNLTLLMVRGRFGGRMTDASGVVFSDSWKA